MVSRSRSLLWLFTLVGLAASSASTYVHANLLRNPSYTSVCDINDTFGCTDAYLSPYGSLFGVPVAIFGVVFFLVIAGLLVAERRTAPAPTAANIPGYIFAIATVGLSVVLYLAYAAFFVLREVCIFCVLTYVATIGIFLIAGAASTVPMTSLPARALRDLRAALTSPIALGALLLLVAGSVAAFAYFPREAHGLGAVASDAGSAAASAAQAAPAQSLSPQQRAEVEQWFDMQPRRIVPEDPAGAAVLILKFNDYQCPPCGKTYTDYKPILKRYASEAPGRVRYISKDFPLDPKCNAATPTGMHAAACDAAVAVRLAREKGKAEAMEDWIVANQPSLTNANVRQAARDIAGVADFDAGYKKVIDQVKADAAQGVLLEVKSTPTFFINGVKIDGGLAPQYFDAVIAHALKKSGQ